MIGEQPGRARSRRFVMPALAALTAAALCSCTSSAGGAHQSSSVVPSSVTAPSTGATGSAADNATAAAIKDAYRKLFSPSTPLDQSIAALQNGAAFKAPLIEQGKSPMAKNSSAAVSKVMLLSPRLARVTYAILLSGKPVLPGQTGYAVREDGAWKVADKTFCGLLALNGSTPAACKRPSATSLPGAG